MNRNVYRKTWLKLHRSYQKKIYRIFIREVKRIAKGIPLDNLNADSYEALIRLNIPKDAFYKAYFDSYLIVGLLHGKRVGHGINRDMKRFVVDIFANEYRRTLAQWLLENGGKRIESVSESLAEHLIKVIAEGIEEGKDMRTIIKEIQKLVRSRPFYRWQAARIARTEATSAANHAASIAGKGSGIVLEKEWISSNDKRTRRDPGDKYPDRFDHIEVDGDKVPEEGMFNVQGNKLLYPGDLVNGHPSNTINCRCALALVPKRDEDGRLIFKQ